MDTPTSIFGLLVLAVGLFATAAYGMITVHHKTARRCFYATALFLVLIGIEIGVVTSWPLNIKIVVGGSFAFAAVGGLIYILNSEPFLTGITGAKVLQPEFIVLPPEGSHVLLWGPPQEMYMQTVNWKGKLPKSFVGGPYPLFRIKNLGATTAFSVRAKWEQGIEETSFISMISRSSAFQKYNAKYNDKEGRFYIGGEETKTNQWNMLIYRDFTQTFPFIAPQIDNTTYVEFAIPLYTLAEIYFCAAISGQSDPTSSEPISIPFKLTISWDRPEGGVAATFNVIATARNMNKNPPGRSQLMTEDGAWRNPPLVMAEITFEIEQKGGP